MMKKIDNETEKMRWRFF